MRDLQDILLTKCRKIFLLSVQITILSALTKTLSRFNIWSQFKAYQLLTSTNNIRFFQVNLIEFKIILLRIARKFYLFFSLMAINKSIHIDKLVQRQKKFCTIYKIVILSKKYNHDYVRHIGTGVTYFHPIEKIRVVLLINLQLYKPMIYEIRCYKSCSKLFI